MNKKEFYDLLKKIESNEYKEGELSLTVGFFGEDPEALILDDELAVLLANALKQNNFIKNINLTGNHIGDKGAIALASVDTLDVLDLYSNYVSTEGGIALVKSNLKELFLPEVYFCYKNELHDQYQWFINTLIENKTIKNLNLYNNYLSEELVSQLITNNKTIKNLDITVNDLTDNVLANIKENITLEVLNISRNNITDKGIEYICENYSIKNLILNGTNVTDKGIKLLSQHPTIRKLSIGGCDNLTPEGLKCLIGSNLEEVYVSSNKISDEMLYYFQEAFEYVKKQKLQSSNEQEKFFSQTEVINDPDIKEDNTIELIGSSHDNDDSVS